MGDQESHVRHELRKLHVEAPRRLGERVGHPFGRLVRSGRRFERVHLPCVVQNETLGEGSADVGTALHPITRKETDIEINQEGCSKRSQMLGAREWASAGVLFSYVERVRRSATTQMSLFNSLLNRLLKSHNCSNPS